MPDYDWELMFVDDGSRDGSFEAVRRCASATRVRALRFPRNFGSHIAIAAGMDHCRGDAAIVMAADLQDPPSLIREFVRCWREGYDVVWGARTGRDDHALRAWGMSMFYRLVRRFAIPTYPPGGTGSFCLISRPVIDVFRQCQEHNRLTFGLVAWSGFRETSVPYHRPQRLIGSSSWTLRKMVKAAMDTFISFSSLPIRAISILGVLVSALSFVLGIRRHQPGLLLAPACELASATIASSRPLTVLPCALATSASDLPDWSAVRSSASRPLRSRRSQRPNRS